MSLDEFKNFMNENPVLVDVRGMFDKKLASSISYMGLYYTI